MIFSSSAGVLEAKLLTMQTISNFHNRIYQIKSVLKIDK